MIMPLTIEKDRWCKRALDALIKNSPPEISVPAEWFEDEIAAGNLTLAAIKKDGVTVGTFIYRLEADEFVVMNLEGDTGEIVMDDLFNVITYHAKRGKSKSIRYHTMRPAMVKAGTRNGFNLEEIIMRKLI